MSILFLVDTIYLMKFSNTYHLIERLSKLLRSDIRQSIYALGLQPIQLEALHYLSRCNKYSDTPLAVADYLGQTKGSISQSLKVLENKGYLIKLVDLNDKRVNHLKLTRQGHELLETTIPSPLFRQLEQQLDSRETEQLNQTLEHLIENLLNLSPRKSFGICKNCRFNQQTPKGNYCTLLEQPLGSSDIEKICKEYE